ncbi:hypothetical protein DH2020_033563 [Rehmannia glutinosa]|uniref:Pentatricopeptide repeat-containing protein n=1 Tax=Rehmannia glutinosa TaxID=99300 RepID=A0ABR0VBW6_REHGL
MVPLYGRGRSPSESESKKPKLGLTNIPPRPPAVGVNALQPAPTSISSDSNQQNNPNPLLPENQAFPQQQYFPHPFGNYTSMTSPTFGSPTTNSSFSPTINMVGEIVFAGMFGSSDSNLFAYPYSNSYPFPGNGSPRLRRQEIQTRNLLSRIKPTRSDYDVVQVLEQWVAEGGKVHVLELRRIIRDLRSRRRFSQALQWNGKLLDEMELQTDICNDWATYSIVAYHLMKANQKEKALMYMKKLEDNLDKDAVGYNHLISLYAHLGNKDEMMRLWVLQKRVCKKQTNRDYITMLGSLVKLGELETAEAVLKEWDSSCHTYDFRVPNILLIGYCQKGLIDKAEIMLRNIVNKGKKPTPNSWAIIAAGYSDNSNFEKAFECMKEALAAKECNVKWTPKPGLIAKLLNWIGDKGEIEEVEAFVWSLRAVVSVNRQMYHALFKASIRGGRDTAWILDRMRTDEIVVDDETEKMVGLR